MAEIHKLPVAEQPTLEAVRAAYPRQQGMHYLDRVWLFVLAEISATDLLMAFQRYAAFCRRESIEYTKIRTIRTYIEDKCWNDVYELPANARPVTDYDGEALKRQLMERKANAGDKQALDWLKRNPVMWKR